MTAAADALRSTSVGLWTPALEAQPGPRAQEVAAELDELGYGSLWLPEAYGREAFTGAQALLAATSTHGGRDRASPPSTAGDPWPPTAPPGWSRPSPRAASCWASG